MSGKNADGGVLDDDGDEDGDGSSDSDGGGDGKAGDDGGSREDGGKDDKEYFQVPSNLSGARHFKGITKNKKTCEVEITVRLPSRCVPGVSNVLALMIRTIEVGIDLKAARRWVCPESSHCMQLVHHDLLLLALLMIDRVFSFSPFDFSARGAS